MFSFQIEWVQDEQKSAEILDPAQIQVEWVQEERHIEGVHSVWLEASMKDEALVRLRRRGNADVAILVTCCVQMKPHHVLLGRLIVPVVVQGAERMGVRAQG